MKKLTFISIILLSSCIGYLAGTGSQLSAQSHIGGDADKVATEAQYLVMRKEAVVENSIDSANENWRIDENGVAYFKQIVLETAGTKRPSASRRRFDLPHKSRANRHGIRRRMALRRIDPRRGLD